MSTEASNQLVPVGISAGALSVAEIIAQGKQIEELMREVMKEGLDRDYGTIPGTKKPSLLKPGAEKILSKFRLATSYVKEERDLGDGHWLYTIICRLTHIPTGAFVGEGLGCCSTLEQKYQHAKDNPAAIYNTVLKMARKRAMVDAIMTATSASDFFTQDTEDGTTTTTTQGDRPKGYTETVGILKDITFERGYWNCFIAHKRHWTQEAGTGVFLDKYKGLEVLAKSVEVLSKKEGKPNSFRILSIEPIVAEVPLPEEFDQIPENE